MSDTLIDGLREVEPVAVTEVTETPSERIINHSFIHVVNQWCFSPLTCPEHTQDNTDRLLHRIENSTCLWAPLGMRLRRPLDFSNYKTALIFPYCQGLASERAQCAHHAHYKLADLDR